MDFSQVGMVKMGITERMDFFGGVQEEQVGLVEKDYLSTVKTGKMGKMEEEFLVEFLS